MPRTRPKGVFERSPIADIFKNTLARIPTLYGRLMYLSSLRDPSTGTYRHHGLSVTYGRDRSVRALQESHEKVFEEWQNLGLAEKHRDLVDYFASLEEPAGPVVQHWIKSEVYRSFIPVSATTADKELYGRDLNVLLDLLNFAGAAKPDPGSSLHR